MTSINTLVFGGGEIHDWQGCQPKIVDALSQSKALKLNVVQEDLAALEAENLAPFQVLVFHYTVGRISDTQRDGLSSWLASGKGFVGVHSAADSFRDDPDYRNLVGGHFVTHPHFRDYQVSVKDADHPIMQGIESEFMVSDEQYLLDFDHRVHVLANALWQGDPMPVAWTKQHGEGRVFYLALGHNPEACEHLAFRKMLLNGTLWAGQVV